MAVDKNLRVRQNDRRMGDLEQRLGGVGYCLDTLLAELDAQQLSLTPGAITRLRQYAEEGLKRQDERESIRSQYAEKSPNELKAALKSHTGRALSILTELLAEKKERYRQEHSAWSIEELREAYRDADPAERGILGELIHVKKQEIREQQAEAEKAKKQAQQKRRKKMTARQVLASSCAADTRDFKKRLTQCGPEGILASLLFSAYKTSSRAKQYRGGIRCSSGRISFRDLSYDRKAEHLNKLAEFLSQHESLVKGWGWGTDPDNVDARYVLYIDLPGGQVSFHSCKKYTRQVYPGQWDGQNASEQRILAFCDQLLKKPRASTP